MAPLPEADTPLSVPDTEEVQVYVVPAIVEVGMKFKASPLQIASARSLAAVVITGVGLTVTVTSTGVPEHPFEEGVTE
jgi:hypothetical protein